MNTHMTLISYLIYSLIQEEAPKNVKDTKKGHLVGMHTTTFKDFMLKEELLQSITRNGFEHPSQGELQYPHNNKDQLIQ